MINATKYYAYFDKFHGPVEQSSNGWYVTNCPFCGKRKFAINLDYGTGKCWRGCQSTTLLTEIIMRSHGITYYDARELVESMHDGLQYIPESVSKYVKVDMQLPAGYTPILSGTGVMGNRARAYLEGRGFDLNYMDMIGVGYCQDEGPTLETNFFGYIIIPFKKQGMLVYYIGRDYIGNYIRYKNPPKEMFGIGKAELIFNEEALQLCEKVYVTEGWADASTIKRAGTSIQGAISSPYQNNLLIKSPVKQLVIIPDAGYYLNGLVMAKALIPYKEVKVLNMDSVKEFGKDVNEVGVERVYALEAETPLASRPWIYKEMRAHA